MVTSSSLRHLGRHLLAITLFVSMAQACGAQGYVQDASVETATANPSTAQGSSSSSSAANDTGGNAASSLVQGGNGWPGDVNVASNSKDYLGLTLDQLMAGRSGLAQALARKPDVEAAIRRVAQETGVPAGLLAGLIYQESSFDVASVSDNPNPTPDDPRDVGLTQAPEPDFNGGDWQDPYTNIHLFVTKYFLSSYEQSQSWGYALRLWNSGTVLDKNNLSEEHNHTDPNYITEILGTHCLGKD